MSINFQGSKRSEISELEHELNHMKLERRVEAMKKVNNPKYDKLCIGNCSNDSR